MTLKGKVAIITGAAGGIGRAIALELITKGVTVVISDLDYEKLQDFTRKILTNSKQCFPIKVDITNNADISEMVEITEKKFGSIDILINNAGGGLNTPTKLMEVKESHWDLVINVNLKGTFICSQMVAKKMIEQRSGKIINIASLAGRTAGLVTGPHYSAAKGGVIAMTRQLAKELGPYGITVNAVAPSTVLSGERVQRLWNNLSEKEREASLESTPLRRLSLPEEQAKVVAFLASEDANFITGATIDVNGGRFMA